MGLAELLAIAPVVRSVESSGGEGVAVETGVGKRESRRTVATLVVALPVAVSAALSIGRLGCRWGKRRLR